MTAQAKTSLTDGTTAGALRALASAGSLEEHGLNVISLEALQAGLGERWSAKQEQVWNQVERFLRHELRPEDLILRLDPVSVLVVQPGRSRIAAQTRCVRVAGDLMRFFLGESPSSAINIRVVDAIHEGEVVCSPLPAPQLQAALMARNSTLWAVRAAWRVPMLTPLGRDLSVNLSLAPVISLQTGRGGVTLVAETIVTDVHTGEVIGSEDRCVLQSSDAASVDIKILTEAFARKRELPADHSALIVPVSSMTLANSSARYGLLDAVHKLTPAERQSLVWEIVGLEPGAPAGRLADLAAIARHHCRGVICSIEPSIANAEKVKSAGATLSTFPGRDTRTEYSLLKQEGLFSGVAKRVHAVLLHQLAPDLIPVAAFIGVTHCTVADSKPSSSDNSPMFI